MRLQGEPPGMTKEELEREGARELSSNLVSCSFMWLGFTYYFALEEQDGRLEWVCTSIE